MENVINRSKKGNFYDEKYKLCRHCRDGCAVYSAQYRGACIYARLSSSVLARYGGNDDIGVPVRSDSRRYGRFLIKPHIKAMLRRLVDNFFADKHYHRSFGRIYHEKGTVRNAVRFALHGNTYGDNNCSLRSSRQLHTL